MKYVWLVCKKDGDATVYKMAEQDVESYVNALRDKGFRDFEISVPKYGINDQGKYNL